MRRALALLPLLALLGVSAPAAAAVLVDPAETAGAGRLRLDGEAELILGRDLRLEEVGRRVETEARNFLVVGTYGLLAELDGFLTLGASRLRVTDERVPGVGRFDGEVGLAFGGGLRYRFFDQRLFKVGGQLALARLESGEGDVTASWIEYDLMLATSIHVFRSLVPYLGLSASIIDGDFEGPLGRTSFRQDNVLGAVAGIRYAATAQVKATLAGRLFDQSAVAFTLSFGF